jgi:hypothetical protein
MQQVLSWSHFSAFLTANPFDTLIIGHNPFFINRKAARLLGHNPLEIRNPQTLAHSTSAAKLLRNEMTCWTHSLGHCPQLAALFLLLSTP